MAKYSPIRTGTDPRKDSPGDGGGNHWLKLSAGDQVDAISLVEVDEIVACDQCAIWLDDGNSPVWVFTGPEDPSIELGVEKRYRAYLPCVVDGEVKVWSMGRTSHKQLLDIADAAGTLIGMELRIKRTGSGLATRWSVIPRGKRHDVSKYEEVDVISMLGPLTAEGVQDLIAKKLGKESYEEVLAAYAGKRSRKKVKDEEEEEEVVKPKRKKKAAPIVVDDDDEEDDDDDDDDLVLK